ncbi:hypothetical protein ACCO45_002583 [Purpureocillium lilacinum]|uniref:Uncharacterized protein n=1 Tax=Purpureocillium lilacinum TaxID=33203 RepID=A0ACC4EC72_PURLI
MMPGWPAAAQQAPGVPQPSTPASYAYPSRLWPVPSPSSSSTVYRLRAPTPPAAAALQQPPPAPPAASQQPKGKTDWPESVRRYVQRSFLPQNEDPTVPRAEVENKLKETIGVAKENGTLYTIDWDNTPLPQALVKAERDARSKGDAVSGSSASGTLKSKKRKSSEYAEGDGPKSPWRTANLRGSLEDRVSYPANDKRLATETSAKQSKFSKDAASKRKRRFESEYKAVYRSPSPTAHSSGPIVGTSETLEKRYLRLTAPPVASNVRPEKVLRQTLDLLKKKWRDEGNYSYICDQFKSMRQDLTVQHIKNDFTVSVYEIHARIALEKGTSTQLRSLYGLGLKGHPHEFKAYRILYFIHTANRSGLNDILADLTTAEKEERPIKHALNVRSALALGNYHKFFQLYLDTPNMGAYLMDMFVVRERLAAMSNICKSYKPDVKLRFITEELAFESDADAAQFIIDHQGQHLLEDRQDHIAFLAGKAGSLFESFRATAFSKVDIKGQI